MIACCNDGTRPVIFKIERIDIPENKEKREWLKSRTSGMRQRMHIQDELQIPAVVMLLNRYHVEILGGSK